MFQHVKTPTKGKAVESQLARYEHTSIHKRRWLEAYKQQEEAALMKVVSRSQENRCEVSLQTGNMDSSNLEHAQLVLLGSTSTDVIEFSG